MCTPSECFEEGIWPSGGGCYVDWDSSRDSDDDKEEEEAPVRDTDPGGGHANLGLYDHVVNDDSEEGRRARRAVKKELEALRREAALLPDQAGTTEPRSTAGSG
jgi:hypothetical protein